MSVNLAKTLWLLQNHQVVAIPTETVYGLAASIFSPQAIERVFAIKSRPRANPLIIHIANKEQLTFASWTMEGARALMHHFWPGPLTLVLPLKQTLSSCITSNLPTVAVRMPNHSLCRHLLEKSGPVVAPSANPSGKPSPTSAQHVIDDYNGSIPVLNGGICTSGVESTILIWDESSSKWKLGRLGALAAESFGTILGYVPELALKGEQAVCPGQHWRHYAPNAKLYPLQANVSASAVIGFSNKIYSKFPVKLILGSVHNPHECLNHLYQCLREIDKRAIDCGLVDMDFPDTGLWATLRERLTKAMSNSASH